jgi:translation initiation factor 4A
MVERENFANSATEDYRNETNGESSVPVEETVFESNWDVAIEKFDDMGLREDLLRGIYGHGFKEPSPI